MKKSLIALIAIILVVTLIATTSCLPTVVNIAITEDDMEQAYATNDGIISRQITVNSGDSFTVTLYAHFGAGLRWSAGVEDTSVVRSKEHRIISDDPPGTVGGPGTEVWTFKALNTGVVTITMTYSAGPDGIQNVNTLELVVEVDGG